MYRTTDQDQLVIAGPDSLEEQWRAFHVANPQVYAGLVKLARLWVERRPGRRLGVKMLFERLRWDLAIQTVGEPLKLNNNYTAFYAREIMRREVDLDGLFNTRRQRVTA